MAQRRKTMPFTHTIEEQFVHIRWSGVLTKDDLQAIGKLLPAIGAQLRRAPHVLHNFDAVERCAFPPIAALEQSVQRKRVQMPFPVKSATVARTPEVLAMARVFQALNRNQNLEMEIFDSEEAARRWLTDGVG